MLDFRTLPSRTWTDDSDILVVQDCYGTFQTIDVGDFINHNTAPPPTDYDISLLNGKVETLFLVIEDLQKQVEELKEELKGREDEGWTA